MSGLQATHTRALFSPISIQGLAMMAQPAAPTQGWPDSNSDNLGGRAHSNLGSAAMALSRRTKTALLVQLGQTR